MPADKGVKPSATYLRIKELTDEDMDKLDKLPGLIINEKERLARGTFDAVNAGLERLGMPPLSFKEVYDHIHSMPLHEALHGKLREYQVRGFQRLTTRLQVTGGALLADDVGLGKTLQAIAVAISMLPPVLEEGAFRQRLLVICPVPAMLTWKAEFQKWVKALPVAFITPGMSEKAWREVQTAYAVVCSYDYRMLERTLEGAFDTAWPTMVILDEYHRARGRKSRRYKALDTVMSLSRYKLAITATPQYDRPRDLWAQLSLIWPKAWGTRYAFDKAYCAGRQGEHGFENKGVSQAQELKKRMQFYMVRRKKKDVATDLPPLTRLTRWIPATPEATRAYQAAASGFGATSLHEALVATLAGKAEEALLLAKDLRRFLLFTWMREHVYQFAHTLAMEMDTPCVCITGDMSVKRRADLIRQARDNKWGLVATIDSASESLNLQGIASQGIMHYLPYEPSKIVQAEGRLHRLGTKSPVEWHYLVMENSADEAVLSTVVSKLDMWTQTMDGSRRELRHGLGEVVDGEMAVSREEEILSAIYKEMKEK